MTEPYLEVITGGMFAGKSTALISKGERHARAGKKVIYCKPYGENRYSEDEIVTHSGIKVDSMRLSSVYYYVYAKDWLKMVEADVILIDEAQFYDSTIEKVIRSLMVRGKTVYVAGLDLDFAGNPFSPMATLMGLADTVTKLKAVCQDCGRDAYASARLSSNEDRVELGGADTYKPLCRQCFNSFRVQETD